MTTTYIHKLNLGVNMTYNMRHALTGLAQTWKNLALVLEKSALCPGIVLECCKIILENINKSLKNINIQLVLSDLLDALKNCVKIAKKLNENRLIHVKERGATRILFYSICGVVPVFITGFQNQRNRVRLSISPLLTEKSAL